MLGVLGNWGESLPSIPAFPNHGGLTWLLSMLGLRSEFLVPSAVTDPCLE